MNAQATLANDGVLHLRTGTRSLCGEHAAHWPIVLHATERAGVWCGRCLFAAIDDLDRPYVRHVPSNAR